MVPLDNGYCGVTIEGRKGLVHRLMLAWASGDDWPPPRIHVDHLCHDPDVCHAKGRDCPHRRCANPRHLEYKTPGANNARSGSPSARNIGKTHCPKGHPYSPENTHVSAKGQRSCISCHRQAYRDWYARTGGKASTHDAKRVCPECGGTKRVRTFRKGVCGACSMRARRAQTV